MHSPNLAIAFFEVVGFAESTTRWTREQAVRANAVHRDLALPAIEAFGGKLVKVSGGSYLAHFASPTNAVLCAAAVHDRAAAFRRTVPAETVEFRSGLAMGEVRVDQKDVFGDAVNIAARLVALAQPGEILLAEVVYLAMNKAEVPSEEVGERDLKGIPEKVRVYRVPRGVYRLSSAGPVPEGAEGLPYGGLGLAHAPNLPPVNPERPGSASAMLPAVRQIATGLGASVRGRARGIAVAAVVLLLLVGGWSLFRAVGRDPIEKMIERGDLDAAKTAIEALPQDGHRSYLEGRLVEGSHPVRSVTKYVEAIREGNRSGAARLVLLLDNPECEAKEQAARALGALHEASAREALHRLAASSDDQGIRIGGILSFGCNPASAARDALRDLDAGDAG